MLQNIQHRQRGPTTMYDDYSEWTVKLANNPMASHMTNHIDIRQHYTKELVYARTIKVISIPTSVILTGGLTKPFPQRKRAIFFKLCLGSSKWHMPVNDLEVLSQYHSTLCVTYISSRLCALCIICIATVACVQSSLM
jgi:hypothetical protein